MHSPTAAGLLAMTIFSQPSRGVAAFAHADGCGRAETRRHLAARREVASSPNLPSPFRSFEDGVAGRIRDADEAPRRSADAPSVADGGRLVPMVELSDVLRLSRGRGDGDSREDREEMSRMMERSGGYLIVHMGSAEAEAKSMEEMWRCVDALFLARDRGSLNAPMRHQSLTRDKSSLGGYDYLETAINRCNGFLYPDELSHAIGDKNLQHALHAFKLLESIGKVIVAIVVSVGADIPPIMARELVLTVSDDGSDVGFEEETPISCSVHRLCRYAVAGSGGVKAEEILRSHTDWTLATIVPVANIAGLEVWHPAAGSWVRPEVSAQRYWEGQLNVSGTNGNVSWNSRFIVVMAGKWTEILTKGAVQSAIHRVVATTTEARMSAPFFLRPRQRIPLDIQRHFGEGSTQSTGTKGSSEGGVECMHHYFLKHSFM